MSFDTAIIPSFPHLQFKHDELLAPYTFMKVGGIAEYFVEVYERKDLVGLCQYCFSNTIPFQLLGGCSNVVISDMGIKGLVIRNTTHSMKVLKDSEEEPRYRIYADSGVTTAHVATYAVDLGFGGLESFVGVPGTIGGAIFNNSHFKATDLIGNLIESVDVCSIEGNVESWKKESLQFDYDYSIFHTNKAVILGATFSLSLGVKATLQERIRDSAVQRAVTQPIGIPSSGCMYRNPQVTQEQFVFLSSSLDIPPSAIHQRENGSIQIAAGFLIDRAGLKGKRIGDVQVSEKHATYMVNLGQATATDIEKLCSLVEEKVLQQFKIHLEREVFFLS